MDSGAPGLWARRVALGTSGRSEEVAERREAAVVVEVRKAEGESGQAQRPHGVGDVPGEGRRQASLSGAAPEGMARGEVQGVTAPGESARSVPASTVVGDEAVRRIGVLEGDGDGWPAGGGARVQMGAGAVERTREAMDLRGLIETAEDRRARVEACR